MERKRPYRFLFVSAPFGGIEVFVRNLKQALADAQDVQCDWIFLEQNPPELIARLPPISLNWRVKAGVVTSARIRTLERDGGSFDAVFFNHITPTGLIGRLRHRIPSVMSLDSTPLMIERFGAWYLGHEKEGRAYRLKSMVKKAVTRRAFQRSTRLLAWSPLVKRSLEEDYGIDARRIEVLPPGIDLRLWGRPPVRQAASGSPVKVLFVGGDFHRKGGDLLLSLARTEGFRSCEFHFVTDGAVIAREENIFPHRGLAPNSDELRRLYREADIFVLPTRADLAPTTAICEAMAMGLPVITTDVGGLAETVSHGEVGFIVPVDDSTALGSRLAELVRSPELRHRLGMNGRRLVEERMDIDKTAAAIVTHLKAAADERRAQRA